MTRPGRTRGRRGGERAVAERPVSRPPRDPERPPARPVSRARYRRRRLAALLAGLVLLVGLGLGARVLLYDAGLFDVESVRVAGTVTVPEAQVLDVAAVAPGGPLVAVDTGAVARRVAQLPAVESVHVGRAWPHTVTVTVTERTPLATVTTAQGPALVDRTGVVYRGAPAPDLPRLTTVPRSGDPTTMAAVTVLAALPEDLRGQVETVGAAIAVPGAPAQVTLGLTEGRQVRWGDAERSGEKAAVLAALLTQSGTVYDVATPALPTIRR